MIPVSNDYRRQLIAGNRNYLIKVDMTLADETTLELTNANIWDNGIVINEAISSDSSFDLGAAIIGSLKIIIDNINGNYSQYDFYDARLVLWLGVTGDVDEHDVQRYYRIGFYVVDEPNYNGSLITLNCLDNMTWFDVPFENITTQATTAGQLVAAICSQVGVTLGTVAFPNYTTVIDVEFDKTVNCREVLQYVAQMCCCYCKIDRAGELVLKWYDKQEIIGITDYDGGTYHTTTTPYSDGCDLDGGHFNPWDGDNADGGTFGDLLNGAVLSQNFSIDVSTDDVVITGCRVRNNTSQDDPYDELWVDPVVEQDHDRYVLVIENNPFITSTNAAAIANTVGSTLAGLPVRGFKSTSLSDFSYETGDMVMIIDFRGNRYYTWITSFTFTTNNSEEFSCGVESLRKRSEERYSSSTKTLAEANENASAILTDYDKAQAEMNELAQEALGYEVYEADVTGGGHVTWLYSGTYYDDTDPEHPLFPDSDNVIMISGDGLFISKDHGAHYYEGLDANSGTAILNMIFAHGINCDWIHAGTLTLGGTDDVNGLCSVLDAQGTEQVRLDHTGINVNAGTISGATIRSWRGTTQSNSDSVTISGGSLRVYNTSDNYLRITDVHDSNCNFAIGGKNVAGYDSNHYYGDSSTPCPPWGICKAGYEASSGSDKRLKTHIKKIDTDYTKQLVLNLSPVSFTYKINPDQYHFGLIAQDVRKILDDMGEDRNLYFEHMEGDYHTIEYKELIAHLINCVKDLYSEVDSLKQELTDLKVRVE